MKNSLRQAARPLQLIATAVSCFVVSACGDVGQKQATVNIHDTALAEGGVGSSYESGVVRRASGIQSVSDFGL
jgi:hypothetical protein